MTEEFEPEHKILLYIALPSMDVDEDSDQHLDL